MHTQNIKHFQHSHNFHEVKQSNYNKVLTVVLITFITMIAEIVFGWIFRSMALLSDGWHMATHASALTITLATYYFSKKHLADTRYAFGTWKIEILGAYTSALFLLFVGVMVVYASIERLLNPVAIFYDQAIAVSILGLIINIICVGIIGNAGHHHEHEHVHEHEQSHAHKQGDLNIKAVYFHVIADALTSIFAIAALVMAKFFNMAILDPFMGILSAVLIFRWSWGLLKATSVILLDRNNTADIRTEIIDIIESDKDSKVSDLHLWQVGQDQWSCVLTIVANTPKDLVVYKKLLKAVHELAHITIEIITCPTTK